MRGQDKFIGGANKSVRTTLFERKKMAIIGGGASGCLAALHCWLLLEDKVEITLIDPHPRLGYGLAYGTKDTEYLLNVPAANMSAYAQRPEDFEKWVKSHDPHIVSSKYWPFVPRKYFGMYLEECISQIPAHSFTHLQTRVLSLVKQSAHYELTLENNSSLRADYVIVATGYKDHASLSLPLQGPVAHRVISAKEVELLNPGFIKGKVLIVGTGLTAIDIWKRLRKYSEISQINFLSRRGLFPTPHDTQGTSPATLPSCVGKTPLEILKSVQQWKLTTKLTWAQVANHLRTEAEALWSSWNKRQKSQFLRYLRPYWEVIRHRMPAPIAEELNQDLTTGRCQSLAGRIKQVSGEGEALWVSYRERKNLSTTLLETNWIILATGSSIDQSLMQNASLEGVRPCPFGYGLVNDGAKNLWLVGPTSKSSHWEITAVPDIRVQVAKLATQIAEDLQTKNLERTKLPELPALQSTPS